MTRNSPGSNLLRLPFVAVACAGAALVLAAGCAPPPMEAPPPAPHELALSQAPLSITQVHSLMLGSPCDTDAFFTAAGRGQALGQLMVSGIHLHENEVHDCQRLIENGALGPLAGLLVATERLANPGDPSDGVVLAEILNYTGPSYAALAIDSGWSCLWIRGPLQRPGRQWGIAAIRRPTSGSCATEAFDTEPSDTLVVHRLTHGQGGEYPSTGRWMWDAARGENFIGIRCGDAWCEIGREGFNGTAALSGPDDVPGWWDEQPLTYASTTGSGLQVSNLVARIAPARPRIDPADRRLRSREGAHVATVTITGTDDAARAAYERKFGFDPAEDTHRIYMRDHRPVWPIPRRTALRSQGGAWSTNLLYREHVWHGVPGSVRWAWFETDEGMWIPCKAGCCMTDGFET